MQPPEGAAFETQPGNISKSLNHSLNHFVQKAD